MKYDVISIMHRGAEALAARKDGGTAFALYELANNLRLMMRYEVTIEQWNEHYVGQDRDAVDIDKVLPPPNDDADEDCDEPDPEERDEFMEV
jgi:hypothetical protein